MKKIYLLFLILQTFGLVLTLAQLSPQEAILRMQKGINLGNTLEPPLEGGWNNPKAQEYYFDLYKQAGFDCVRIPVRWDEHTQDSYPYNIDLSWLQRVEEVVDWGLQRGLFIVINAHHDDWIKQNYSNASYRARFDSIWSQISVRFRDKSEKLIFEILNEPHGLTKDQNDDLHRRILAIIRKTNPTRIVIFQGHNWGGSDELITSAIPDDNYVIGSFHSYDPYTFGLLGEGTWGSTADMNALNNKFAQVRNWSDIHGIPVFLGEFGSLRTCDYNSRMKHYAAYVGLAQKYGFASCAWDDGGDFRIMERAARKWDEVKDILLHTTDSAPKNLTLKILQDTVIQLNWSNVLSDQDSLFIERRTTNGDYSRIASLNGDTTGFWDIHPLRNQYNHYRILAYYDTGKSLYSTPQRVFMPAFEPGERTAYLGEPGRIPGTIEAENYDVGGEGLTYHDSDPMNIAGDYRPGEGVDIYSRNGNGYHIGNALPGEWYEYTVNVEKQGAYRVDFYLAAMEAGGTFTTRIGGAESGILTSPGSHSWLTTNILTDTLNLKGGIQIMRFTVMGQPLFNIDKFDFSPINLPAGTNSIQEMPLVAYVNQNRDIVIGLKDISAVKRIQIYNLAGFQINSIPDPQINPVISTLGMPGGVYLLRVMTQSADFSSKIVLP